MYPIANKIVPTAVESEIWDLEEGEIVHYFSPHNNQTWNGPISNKIYKLTKTHLWTSLEDIENYSIEIYWGVNTKTTKQNPSNFINVVVQSGPLTKKDRSCPSTYYFEFIKKQKFEGIIEVHIVDHQGDSRYNPIIDNHEKYIYVFLLKSSE